MKRLTAVTAALALSLGAVPSASAAVLSAAPTSPTRPVVIAIPAPPAPTDGHTVTCNEIQACADLAVLCKKAGGTFTDNSVGTEKISASCTV